jgi:NADPH-dependent 2,4-dienoyl-CoA reductase/sulfur reductase-like enzyme
MNSRYFSRRHLLQHAGAAATTAVAGSVFAGSGLFPSALAAPAVPSKAAAGRVVVVGGGFAGATAAKYLRKFSNGTVEVILIERNKEFISCPTSNEVLGGVRDYQTLRHDYDKLKKNWGVTLLHAPVVGIDPIKRSVKTEGAGNFSYDRLVISPGFDFSNDRVAGLETLAAQQTILHAWKAGPQTVALRKQLEALPNGGVYVLTIPKAPFRCPPGPYERACQIAFYFKQHKPKSKVIVLDANDKIQSKEKLFTAVWANDYPGLIEYHPQWNTIAVDVGNRTAISELGDKVKADVLNLLPPMRAGDIAHTAGVVNVNGRWADINWITFESTAVPLVHVLGDAVQAAPLMPKSGHMANQHGKVAAAAILDLLAGVAPRPSVVANTCYSMIDNERAVHVDSVHRYDAEKKTLVVASGSGGLSKEPSFEEGIFARAWAETIWSDVLT